MAKLIRIDNDYSTNRAPRLPICFCIDNSSAVLNSTMSNILDFLKMFSDYVIENSECHAKVQLCIVTYASKPKVVTDFKSVETMEYNIEIQKNEQPNLEAALKKCIELINGVRNIYKLESISHYLPELFVLGSGESTSDITEIAQRLNNAQRENKLSVMPFKISENDSDVLSSLSYDNVVYTKTSDLPKVFECLKGGLEMLSASSASAVSSLKAQKVGWDQFKEKR